MKLPSTLTELDRWVRWRYEPGDPKPRKVPIHPFLNQRAKSDDPSTWGPLATATAQCGKDDTVGLGFVFSEPDGLVGVDFDDCVNEAKEISEPARSRIQALDSYAEFSPSGKGVHVIGHGHLAGRGVNAKGREGVEIYARGRYFTVTGHHVPGTPGEICDFQGPLDALLQEVVPPRQPAEPPATRPRPTTDDYERVIDRARRYVAATPPAVSGQGGHDQTFAVACSLAHGWDLHPFDAWEILKEYSARCLPPWTDHELRHKLDDAYKVTQDDPRPAGYLRDTPSPYSAPRVLMSLVPPVAPWPEDTEPIVQAVTEPVGSFEPVPVLYASQIIATLGKRGPAVPTGFVGLDRALRGGLPEGAVMFVVAPPERAKTAFLVQVLVNMTRHQKVRAVGLFADAGREDAAVRIGQNYGFGRDLLEAGSEQIAARVKAEEGNTILLPDPDDPDMTIEGAAELLRRTALDSGPYLIVLDSLHKVRCRKATKERRFEIEAVVDSVKGLARAGWIVIASAEANRGSYASKDEGARTSPEAAGAESRALDFGPHVSAFMEGSAEEKLTMRLTKNRLGRKPTLSFRFDSVSSRLIELNADDVAREKEVAAEQRAEDRRHALEAAVRAELLGHRAGRTEEDLTALVKKKRIDVRATCLRLEMEGFLERAKGVSVSDHGGRPPLLWRVKA